MLLKWKATDVDDAKHVSLDIDKTKSKKKVASWLFSFSFVDTDLTHFSLLNWFNWFLVQLEDTEGVFKNKNLLDKTPRFSRVYSGPEGGFHS